MNLAIMKKTKIVVIGHSDINSPYGAATSLRNHFLALASEDGLAFYHLYRKGYAVRSSFSLLPLGNLHSIRKIWLPICNIFVHKSPGFTKNLLFVHIPNVMYYIFRSRFIKSLKSIAPDVIHLNSIVLLPVVNDINKNKELSSIPIVMHVRELFDPIKASRYYNEMTSVDCFVCIDQSVKTRLIKLFPFIEDRVILQVNPFRAIDYLDDSIRYLFPRERKIFCVAGVIGEDKGVDFICDAFEKANLDCTDLLVIGRKNSLALKLENKYSGSNIFFLGEIDRLFDKGAFSRIDCLIRGEEQFCTGRTVYESLFSGGFVIVPGEAEDLYSDIFLSEFELNVFMYGARCKDSLISAFIKVHSLIEDYSCDKRPDMKCNYIEYSNTFIDLYARLENLQFKYD